MAGLLLPGSNARGAGVASGADPMEAEDPTIPDKEPGSIPGDSAPTDEGSAPSRGPAREAGTDDVVGDEEGTEEATPEEQAQYEKFVKLGLSLIADKGEQILDLLDEDPEDLREVLGDVEGLNDPNPAMTLAATAVIVVLEAIRRSGGKPDDVIIFHGGKAILEKLGSLGADAGGHDYSQDEMNQAWLHAQDLYREVGTAEGLVDNDALKAQFDEIVTADKEGQLGRVVPGLDKAEVREGEPAPAGEEVNGGVS